MHFGMFKMFEFLEELLAVSCIGVEIGHLSQCIYVLVEVCAQEC